MSSLAIYVSMYLTFIHCKPLLHRTVRNRCWIVQQTTSRTCTSTAQCGTTLGRWNIEFKQSSHGRTTQGTRFVNIKGRSPCCCGGVTMLVAFAHTPGAVAATGGRLGAGRSSPSSSVSSPDRSSLSSSVSDSSTPLSSIRPGWRDSVICCALYTNGHIKILALHTYRNVMMKGSCALMTTPVNGMLLSAAVDLPKLR